MGRGAGERDRKGERRQYKCVARGRRRGGGGGESQCLSKKCNRSEHAGVAGDVRRTRVGVRQTREKTDGDHRVRKA